MGICFVIKDGPELPERSMRQWADDPLFSGMACHISREVWERICSDLQFTGSVVSGSWADWFRSAVLGGNYLPRLSPGFLWDGEWVPAICPPSCDSVSLMPVHLRFFRHVQVEKFETPRPYLCYSARQLIAMQFLDWLVDRTEFALTNFQFPYLVKLNGN